MKANNMFEDSEYTKPAEAFKKAGHELVHVGLKAGETVKGKTEGTPVNVDKTTKEVKVGDFDSPADLPAFIRACLKKLKKIFSKNYFFQVRPSWSGTEGIVYENLGLS
jgi:hypothetical protein